MRLGFDEWQGESFYFKCSCKKCLSLECTGGECQDCGKYVSAERCRHTHTVTERESARVRARACAW